MFSLAFYLSLDIEDDAVKMVKQVQIRLDACANTRIRESILDTQTVGRKL